MKKYCVLYSYYENKESKKNLDFFIRKGITLNEDILFVFIISSIKCSVKIPSQNNIKVLFKDNIGHDYGNWKYGLSVINKDKLDYFIFMNDTVCGPYLPRYIPITVSWYSMFCNLISDKVKLSGLSINYFPWDNNDYKEHVQSMMFCTDRIGLDILCNKIFHLNIDEYELIYKKDRYDYIIRFEIGMSQEIIKNGFKIAALYVCDIHKHKTGDIWYDKIYFETTINPFETMFVKTNRLNSKLINFYYSELIKNN
jgi:lipopolysaccharide biosynthesis protein